MNEIWKEYSEVEKYLKNLEAEISPIEKVFWKELGTKEKPHFKRSPFKTFP